MRDRNYYRRALWKFVTLGMLLASTTAYAGQMSNSTLFSRSKMKEMDLKGLRVWLGHPVEVTAQIGWQMSWPKFKDVWSFVHLTPFMARFPEGELIVTYTLDPDTQSNPVFLSGFQISKDGGAHWGQRYSVLMQHIPMVFIPKPDNSLLAIPSELMEETPGDNREFRGPYYLFEHGGDRMVMVPDGVHVVDWPWPAEIYESPQPRDSWHTGVIITGNALKVGNRLLATGYFQKKGEKLNSAVILASEDGGYTWRYFSTVAGPNPSLASQRSYEGANEMSMIRLADGDLMAVFRTGSGREWKLHRAYSHDGGRTWSKPDALPAWSVMPVMVRSADGTIVLATGRPGIDLWFSTDPRAATWQDIDVVAFHNRSVSNPNERISSFKSKRGPSLPEITKWQTSSYTGLVQVAPNRLLLVYDRDPETYPNSSVRKLTSSKDLSRVFVLPIEVQRD